jgi:RNA methyltransferase, TrmH family
MDTTRPISKAKLKYLKTLAQKKHRLEEGLFVIEGWRAVEEACRTALRIPLFVYTSAAKDHAEFASVFASASTRADEAFEVTERELAAITETVTAQGVAIVARHFSFTLKAELHMMTTRTTGLIVALDRLAEPGNVGTIIRSADWFGADAVLLGEESVELYNPKVVRSTMGSLFHLPVIVLPAEPDGIPPVRTLAEALQACHAEGFTIYGADVKGAADIRTVRWAHKSVIVFGNEARGLTPEIASLLDERVAIPKFGNAESLNAAAAAAVMLASVRLH